VARAGHARLHHTRSRARSGRGEGGRRDRGARSRRCRRTPRPPAAPSVPKDRHVIPAWTLPALRPWRISSRHRPGRTSAEQRAASSISRAPACNSPRRARRSTARRSQPARGRQMPTEVVYRGRGPIRSGVHWCNSDCDSTSAAPFWETRPYAGVRRATSRASGKTTRPDQSPITNHASKVPSA
jgi:hypothetical protein